MFIPFRLKSIPNNRSKTVTIGYLSLISFLSATQVTTASSSRLGEDSELQTTNTKVLQLGDLLTHHDSSPPEQQTQWKFRCVLDLMRLNKIVHGEIDYSLILRIMPFWEEIADQMDKEILKLGINRDGTYYLGESGKPLDAFNQARGLVQEILTTLPKEYLYPPKVVVGYVGIVAHHILYYAQLHRGTAIFPNTSGYLKLVQLLDGGLEEASSYDDSLEERHTVKFNRNIASTAARMFPQDPSWCLEAFGIIARSPKVIMRSSYRKTERTGP